MKTETSSAAAIDSYIDGFPPDVKARLNDVRATIRKAAPMASEKISYGIPTFYYNGNLVHFAAFKEHIGFFPTPSVVMAFAKELQEFKTAKGSVQFPLSRSLPLSLIARMVKYRVAENSKKIATSEPKKRLRS